MEKPFELSVVIHGGRTKPERSDISFERLRDFSSPPSSQRRKSTFCTASGKKDLPFPTSQQKIM